MKKICFDVGGTSVKVVCFDENNDVIAKDKITYDERKLGKLFHFELMTVRLEHVLTKINDYILKNNHECQVGISFPGVVDICEYKIKTTSSIVEIDVNILDFFKSNQLIKKLVVENDAKAAAIGELVFGQNNALNNAVIITLGSGIGGGIIINNKVYKGSNFQAGEFSGIFDCLSSKMEKFEVSLASASTQSMCKDYEQASGQAVNGLELLELVKKSDPVALKIFERATTMIAKFAINLKAIFDCDVVLIGGGISEDQFYIETVKKLTSNFVFFKVNIESCKLTNSAACYGMLAILTEKYKY